MNELFQSLPGLIANEEIGKEISEAVVFAAWRKIAGESIRRQTAPRALHKSHFIIAVSDEKWAAHLQKLSGEMLFRLSSLLRRAEVKYIEFRIDQDAVEAEQARFKSEEKAAEDIEAIAAREITPDMRKAARSIRNESLRKLFLNAAGSSLAWKAAKDR